MRPTVADLLKDPKHKADADYARELHDAITREQLEKAKAKPKESAFGFLFDKTEAEGAGLFDWIFGSEK